MLILDEAAHPPIAFPAGKAGGIHLSQLPDPRSVREADGWEGCYGPGDGKPQVARRL